MTTTLQLPTDPVQRFPAPETTIAGDSVPAVVPAARAVDATKIYGSGDTAVRALDDVDRRLRGRPLHRHHGPVGLGQVDAHAHASPGSTT